MSDLLSVGEATAELRRVEALEVEPRAISRALYDGVLNAAICPVVGGRRLIPRAYLPAMAIELRRRGLGRKVEVRA